MHAADQILVRDRAAGAQLVNRFLLREKLLQKKVLHYFWSRRASSEKKSENEVMYFSQ